MLQLRCHACQYDRHTPSPGPADGKGQSTEDDQVEKGEEPKSMLLSCRKIPEASFL